MMTFLEIITACFFGLVQGFSEFLPVSSSGHLVLLKSFLETELFSLFFILVLHLGTLAVITGFYKKELLVITKAFISKPLSLSGPGRAVYLLMCASLPGMAGAFFLSPLVKQSLNQSHWTGIGFVLTATFLFLSKNTLKKTKNPSFNIKNWDSFSFKTAFIIGLAQVLAFFPGMSRSGWTIVAALFLGRAPKEAVFFSFLLAIPAILGGFIFEIFSQDLPENFSLLTLSFAFLSSWFFGWIALKGLIHSLKNLFFPFFAFYLWPLGIFMIFFI